MKIKMRAKGQITIPASLMSALGIKPGDLLDCRLEDGVIMLSLVSVHVAMPSDEKKTCVDNES